MAFDFSSGKSVNEKTTVNKTPIQEQKPDSGLLSETSKAFEKYFLKPLSSFSGIGAVTEFAGKQAQRAGEIIAFHTDPIVREQVTNGEENAKNILPNTYDVTPRKVIGETLRTEAEVAPWAVTKIKGLMKLAGLGAGIGTLFTSGRLLEENEKLTEHIPDIFLSGAISGATSLVLNKLGEKLLAMPAKKSERLIGRTLGPSKKEISSQISRKQLEKGKAMFEAENVGTKVSKEEIARIEQEKATIAKKIADEGYKGSYEKMNEVASTNRAKYGNEINKELEKVNSKIYKKDIINDLNGEYERVKELGLMSESEDRAIQRLIDNIPEEMTAVEANQWKIKMADKVPDSAWDQQVGHADSARADMYKKFSGSFRKQVEKVAPAIKDINEKWAIANDVFSLTNKKMSENIIGGGVSSIVSGGPFSTLIKSMLYLPTSPTSRTYRAQMYKAMDKFSKEEVINDFLNFMIRYISVKDRANEE